MSFPGFCKRLHYLVVLETARPSFSNNPAALGGASCAHRDVTAPQKEGGLARVAFAFDDTVIVNHVCTYLLKYKLTVPYRDENMFSINGLTPPAPTGTSVGMCFVFGVCVEQMFSDQLTRGCVLPWRSQCNQK